MTKSLTEQWREGKIKEGFYYVHFCTGEIVYRHLSGNKPDKGFIELGCFQEILAPVPSYNEYLALSGFKKIEKDEIDNLVKIHTEKLEKKLAIATKALKGICVWANTGNGGEKAVKKVCEKAIKEMEGVK